MQGNDLSNAVPPRVLVHLCAVFDKRPTINKVLKIIPHLDYAYDLDMRAIAELNRWRDKGVIISAFYYTGDGWPAEHLWGILDDHYHPFNRLMEFRDTKNMSDYLAFSFDVKNVVDPMHPIAFGAKSLGQI